MKLLSNKQGMFSIPNDLMRNAIILQGAAVKDSNTKTAISLKWHKSFIENFFYLFFYCYTLYIFLYLITWLKIKKIAS